MQARESQFELGRDAAIPVDIFDARHSERGPARRWGPPPPGVVQRPGRRGPQTVGAHTL